MAMPGGGPGRTDGRRPGGAGGGTERSARAGRTSAAGSSRGGGGAGGTGARVVPRPPGFTGCFAADFAEEFDATAVPGEGGTAGAAEPVRAERAIGCGCEGAGSATIR